MSGTLETPEQGTKYYFYIGSDKLSKKDVTEYLEKYYAVVDTFEVEIDVGGYTGNYKVSLN